MSPGRRLVAVLVLGALVAANAALGQAEVALATRQAKLQNLSQLLKNRDVQERLQAVEFARVAGIPLRKTLPGNRVMQLQRIVPGLGPVYYITNNVDAADTVSTDDLWMGGSQGLELDGAGMTVGEWDAGAVYFAHPDLAGRVTQGDTPESISNHSTHVAGTLIGSGAGLYPQARGMAYAAHLKAWDGNSDTAEMAAEAAAT